MDRTVWRPRHVGRRWRCHRTGFWFSGTTLALLPARGCDRVLASAVWRKTQRLAAGLFCSGDRGAVAGARRAARHRQCPPDRHTGQPLGRPDRRADFWRWHGADPRLRQSSAGALGQRQPARPAVGTHLRRDGAVGAVGRPVATAHRNQQLVDGRWRSGARPAGTAGHGP